MRYGYARATTRDPELIFQKMNLSEHCVPVENIFEEWNNPSCGKYTTRNAALKTLKNGDSLVVTSLSVLSKSYKDLFDVLSTLTSKHVTIISLRENISVNKENNTIVESLLEALHIFGKDITSERTLNGLSAARKKGRRGGRKKKLSPTKTKMLLAVASDPAFKHPDVAKAFGISTASLYRLRAEELAPDKSSKRKHNKPTKDTKPTSPTKVGGSNGRRGGRKRKANETQFKIIKALMGDSALLNEEIADQFGITTATMYRYNAPNASREGKTKNKKKATHKKGGGRKSKASRRMILMAVRAMSSGAMKIADIAEAMNVSESTLYRWRKEQATKTKTKPPPDIASGAF